MPLGEVDVENAVERILKRPAKVREAISSALFEFHDEANGDVDRLWFFDVFEGTEPEDSGIRLYLKAFQKQNVSFDSIRADMEELADSFDDLQISAHATIKLCQLVDTPLAVTLLRKAQRRYPNDFFINVHLASYLAA